MPTLFTMTVDTEEEWHWDTGWPTRDLTLANLKHLPKFQELCSRHGVAATYYVSCRPRDLPIPFAFRVTALEIFVPDGGPALELTLMPLAQGATSLSNGVGGPIEWQQGPLAKDCSFTEGRGSFTLPAAANSLMRDIEFDKDVLRGKFASPERGCAELDGYVPLINLSLLGDGDICVFLLAPPDGSVPLVSDSDYVCDPASLPPRLA